MILFFSPATSAKIKGIALLIGILLVGQVKSQVVYDVDPAVESMEKARKERIKSSDKKKTEGAGKKIMETVDRIFETCKLAPDADAALHPILGEILEGANLLKKSKSSLGNEKIQHGLMKFKKLFNPAPAS